MRICIVTIAGYVHGIGGMQRHTSDLARGLAAAGHDVEVITTKHPEGIRVVEHEGVRWRFVEVLGNQVDRAWHRASHDEFVAAHRERPFDVIHSESTSALGLVRHNVHSTVPIVVKYHGNFIGLARANVQRAARGRTPRAIGREARSFAWLCGQHFPRGNWWRFHGFESMVPSRQQLDDQRRSHLIPRSKMYVVPNGVDATLFRPRDRAALRAELGLGSEHLLISVGRLTREKGVHTAIQALSLLDQPTRLAVVGDGEERERLGQLARSLGVAERVDFLGRQPPEAVARYLAAADAFVFPTERDEGAPLVLVEAMAAGLPVIATDMAQLSEVIDRPGENGLLVPLGDDDALAAAARDLLEDEERRHRIGAAARERVLAEYTLDRMIDRTVAVYEIALGRERRTRP